MHVQRRGAARHQLSPVAAQELEAPGAVLVGTTPGPCNVDRTVGAGDHHAIRQRDGDSSGHLSDDAARKAQYRRGTGVDAGVGKGRAAHHLHRFFLTGLDPHRCRGNQAAHRHRVAANVHDSAAGELVGIESAFGPRRRLEAKARLDVTHLANGAFPHKLHYPARHRVSAVHERLHEETVIALGGIHHRHHLRMVQPHRLLAQHRLASFKRLDGPLRVLWVRWGDVDRIHVDVVEQGLVAPVRGHALPALNEGLRRVSRATSHGRQRGALRRRDGIGESVCDSARGQDPPTSCHADSADLVIRRIIVQEVGVSS